MERNETVKECYRADKIHDATALRAILAEEAELIVPNVVPGASFQRLILAHRSSRKAHP